MDYLRVLLVPFHPTILILVAVFAALMAFCLSAGFYGWFAALLLQVWVFKYCYVLVEQLADGAREPPVMDVDMLSPFEIRPWIQAAFVGLAVWAWVQLPHGADTVFAIAMLALFPATVAILGFGEPWYQAINPLTLYRVIRGLGPLYPALLAALGLAFALPWLAGRLGFWSLAQHAVALLCEVAFFALVGGSLFVRRRQLGFTPTRSPERLAERVEHERRKVRDKMVDDMFQLVRIGKHVDATEPLAHWLREADAPTAVLDSFHVIEQALRWDSRAALNPIGSTVIRHLLRFGRPDAALKVFERLRGVFAGFTMDSAPDLRTLADYADSIGREELAATMRLETPIFHPPA